MTDHVHDLCTAAFDAALQEQINQIFQVQCGDFIPTHSESTANLREGVKRAIMFHTLSMDILKSIRE